MEADNAASDLHRARNTADNLDESRQIHDELVALGCPAVADHGHTGRSTSPLRRELDKRRETFDSPNHGAVLANRHVPQFARDASPGVEYRAVGKAAVDAPVDPRESGRACKFPILHECACCLGRRRNELHGTEAFRRQRDREYVVRSGVLVASDVTERGARTRIHLSPEGAVDLARGGRANDKGVGSGNGNISVVRQRGSVGHDSAGRHRGR